MFSTTVFFVVWRNVVWCGVVYGVCCEKLCVRFSLFYVVLFCAVSDMVDYTELKRAVNLELTLVLNVCAVE